MTKVIPHLWFDSGMEDALSFYAGLLPDAEVEWVSLLPDGIPGGPSGSVRLAGFRLADQHFMALETQGADAFNHSFSLMVECGSQAEVDRIWDGFLEGGGKAEQCGWLRDRWGMAWQVVPKRLGELIHSPDPDVTRRVVGAVMGMVRIEEAALEEAA